MLNKTAQTSRDKEKGARTVDAVIYPLVQSVDIPAQRRGIEIELRFIVREDRVKLRVEDADDLRRLVVHDRVLLLVPEHGHGEPARVGGVRAQIQVLHVSRIVQRVRVRVRELVRRRKRPTFRAHTGRDDGEGCVSISHDPFLFRVCGRAGRVGL